MDHLHPIFHRSLDRADREQLLGQRSLVVWLYGLSGSGKSTLAVALERRLHEAGVKTTLLDGDNVRTGLNAGLGFTDDDRRENIRRIAEVAKLFVDSGLVTIVSFITPLRSLRALARERLGGDLHEVYVECSFETCKERDVKGLYAKAEAGEIPHFTGKDSGFEPPENAELTINTETTEEATSIETLVNYVRPLTRPDHSRQP